MYDLQGNDIPCLPGEKQLFLTASNVTLYNGTIRLGTSPSERFNLFVDGRNVTLDNITIKGAERGLSVRPGSQISLRDCNIEDSMWGVVIGSVPEQDATNGTAPGTPATLVAYNVNIIGFDKMGIDVEPGGNATFDGCNISGGGSASLGVIVKGRFTAAKLMSNVGQGLWCSTGGKAVLECCSLTAASPGEAGIQVRDPGSRADLCCCTLEGEPSKCLGGTVFNRTLVRALYPSLFHGVGSVNFVFGMPTYLSAILVMHVCCVCNVNLKPHSLAKANYDATG